MQVFKCHLFKGNHASELLKLEVEAEINMLPLARQEERAKHTEVRTKSVPGWVKENVR